MTARNLKQGTPCTGRTPAGEGQTTPFCDGGRLCSLFLILDAGATPNFLDIMAALSEMVDFYTNSDLKGDALQGACQNMSQNKCLFCS